MEWIEAVRKSKRGIAVRKKQTRFGVYTYHRYSDGAAFSSHLDGDIEVESYRVLDYLVDGYSDWEPVNDKEKKGETDGSGD